VAGEIAKGLVGDLGSLSLKLFTFADGVEAGERLGQLEAHIHSAPAAGLWGSQTSAIKGSFHKDLAGGEIEVGPTECGGLAGTYAGADQQHQQGAILLVASAG
jgi:hypothetical protein